MPHVDARSNKTSIATAQDRFLRGFIFIALIAGDLAGLAADDTSAPQLRWQYVRPFVGTKGQGNTYPGPSAPFGMIQISPDTDKTNWDTDSGYKYTDPTILGFSLTHLTGTGCPDLGDFLFMPQVGTPSFVCGNKSAPETGYQSAFSHTDEEAAAGYYRVKLQKPGVVAELTAGERAGMLRFTFPAGDQSSIMIDLAHVIGPWRVAQSKVRILDNSTVTGFHLINGWAKERYLYFAARFSRPFDDTEIISSGKPVIYNTYRFRSHRDVSGTNLQFFAKFKTAQNEPIEVKVAVSAVDAAHALQNLEAEIPDWNFDAVKNGTREKWERELGKFDIDGTEDEKATFYTSVYHAFLAPNLYEDVSGEYRGFDQNIHRAEGFTAYTVFSLWDTFRATHPLFALVQTPRDADMINTMLAHYDQSADHMLPIWELQGNETWCMIGYHAVPVIVDAYFKGVKGFDARRAYEAIKTSALNPDYDSVAAYEKLGWVPCDKEDESLSKTLEYAYDDWCVAQMAKALGEQSDYDRFSKRAGNFRNVFDPSMGWMRPKDSQGRWREPFNAHTYGSETNSDLTEATSSQYSWFAPQDIPGLVSLMGGRDKFLERLDSLFTDTAATKELSPDDQRGCIGEYWHGNEPSHHVIYLYSCVGQPWKAAQRLHQLITTQYGDQPDSLCGNDDCGQMSAWYLFACMGFYPVCPGSSDYVIGAPQLKKVVMRLSNGKAFTVTAENLTNDNIYVQSVRLNGKDWASPYLPYNQLKDGGTLAFVMGPKPSRWAAE